jgi:hypothetical protein
MPVAATLSRPRFSRADMALLQPDADEHTKYKPKALYDALMALEVPTLDGGRATVQITPYRLVKGYPKDLQNNGDPEYADLQKYISRSRQVSWSHGSWVLTIEVRDPRPDVGAINACYISPLAGAAPTYSPLLVPASRPQTSSYFTDLPSPLDPNHPEALRIHNHEMMRFFTGKARPVEIRRALFLAQVVGAVAPNQEALQAYCNAHCGMDCSGFALVVYGHVGDDVGSEDFRSRGVERTRIEDFQAGDAIVWRHDNHVAVIDRVGPGADATKIKCWVAESTHGKVTRASAGVQYSEYTFERDDTDTVRKYRMLRPSVTGTPTPWAADKITVRGNPLP